MKKLHLLATFIGVGVAFNAFATAQMNELLLYKGTTNRLCTLPLESYLQKHNLRLNEIAPTKGLMITTACWRGYIGTWEIKDGFLWLLKVNTLDGTEVPLSTIFTNQTAPIKASWYSGKLEVTQGKLLHYVHAAFASKFERHLFIEIDAGKVGSETIKENKVGRADRPLTIGDPAPGLPTGRWVQGDPVQEFQRGKAYLVEFWATWCGPCLVSIPHLNEIHEKYKERNLIVIGQNCWERDESLVEPFVKKMGGKMTYRVALDDKTDSQRGKMAETWMAAAGRNGIPSAFLVNTQGLIAWIGHPMTLKEPVIEAVLEGRFDMQKAAAEYEQEKKMNDLARRTVDRQPRPKVPPPPRDPQATPNMVDLTTCYDAPLTEYLHRTVLSLTEMPQGLQTFNGVQFDVRGLIQLAGKESPVGSRTKVEGIVVGRKARRLHFLHTTGWVVKDGTQIGSYILRYADGQTREIPIVYGEDLREWHGRSDKVTEITRGRMAWAWPDDQWKRRVYQSARDNPLPDVEIKNLDFVSAMTDCFPFLIAITLEETPNSSPVETAR